MKMIDTKMLKEELPLWQQQPATRAIAAQARKQAELARNSLDRVCESSSDPKVIKAYYEWKALQDLLLLCTTSDTHE